MQTNYEKMWADDEKVGLVETATEQIINWEKEGQKVIGQVIDIEPFDNTQFKEKCNRYLIDTNDGMVSCVLGATRDDILEKKKPIGKLIYIEFRGKKKSKNKRTFNDFLIKLSTRPVEKVDIEAETINDPEEGKRKNAKE